MIFQWKPEKTFNQVSLTFFEDEVLAGFWVYLTDQVEPSGQRPLKNLLDLLKRSWDTLKFLKFLNWPIKGIFKFPKNQLSFISLKFPFFDSDGNAKRRFKCFWRNGTFWRNAVWNGSFQLQSWKIRNLNLMNFLNFNVFLTKPLYCLRSTRDLWKSLNSVKLHLSFDDFGFFYRKQPKEDDTSSTFPRLHLPFLLLHDSYKPRESPRKC